MTRWASILIAVLMWVAGGNLRATEVGLIKIDGAIMPATADYVARSIVLATDRKDVCLIIQLDTPGGLLDTTKDIVQDFYDSKIPIVVYVSPDTARAGSAGTFITMAADVAAMAPYARIGAAHPVSIGGLGSSEENTNDVMGKKIENDTAGFIETIAEKRHRNVEWATSAVRESQVIPADKALEMKVVDLIADSVPDLLKKLDGRKVGDKTLHTADATVFTIPMTARESFLQVMLHPGIMFALMLMVMYGIIGELSSPGAILPGVAGAIALILVLYMSAVFPVNIAGVALMLLAVGLFVTDIFAPSHGILTAGGTIAFFLGALMLFDRNNDAFRLSLGYIITATVLTALFFIFIVATGLRAQFSPAKTGKEMMVGQIVKALTRIDAGGGRVFIEGENWRAVSDTAVETGEPVEVVSIEGLTLKVKPKK